jgi:DNA-directed RNA polymerase specialized sigma24 family protein
MVRAVDRVAPGWMADQRDDLVQMAVIKLMRSAQEPPFGDPLLRRVAYTVVVDEVRRRKRRAEVGMSPSLPDRIVNSGELSPEVRAQGVELAGVLVACLQTLAPERRRAVTLWLQDHGIPEIAQLLRWDRKKAANLVYRGLADLREVLRERGLPP